MAMTIELWEDSGTETGSPLRGTTRQEVDNIGWKNSPLDESYPFADYPITRPYNGNLYSVSYTKYHYYKIYGTYDYAHQVQALFEGQPSGFGGGSGAASNVIVLYKWTNSYETPTKDLLDGTHYDPLNPPTMIPLLSTGGPENPGSYIEELSADTTYYTGYLVTQVLVKPGDWDDYGNLNSSFKLKFTLNERKSGLPGYDTGLINWSW